MLFEILGNLVCAGVLALPIILGVKEDAKKNNRSFKEELLSDE